jgi:hypothetical protein
VKKEPPKPTGPEVRAEVGAAEYANEPREARNQSSAQRLEDRAKQYHGLSGSSGAADLHAVLGGDYCEISAQPATTTNGGETQHETTPGAVARNANARSAAGRKANAEFNRLVAAILNRIGADWRIQLATVAEALDQAEVPLIRSARWTKLRCKSWLDVYEDDREGLVKALQHRLDWVSEHPPEKSLPKFRG